MNASVRDWLDSLKKQTDSKGLEHIDLLIDATSLDYPLLQRLAELTPAPQHSLLLAGTPEHAMAAEGPILVRVLWAQSEQQDWLNEFLSLFFLDSRALMVLSRWPFEALTEHLRYCTQAYWDQGASSGILRYYDPRLFNHLSGLFSGDISRNFHAAVISWHWIDRDQKTKSIGGNDSKPHEFAQPQPPLMLAGFQVEDVAAWNRAEQWEQKHGLAKRNYSVSKEQLVTQLYLGQLAARSERLDGEAHTAFIVEWLAKYLPENLPKTGGLV